MKTKRRTRRRRYDPVWPDLLKIAAVFLVWWWFWLALLDALAKSAW